MKQDVKRKMGFLPKIRIVRRKGERKKKIDKNGNFVFMLLQGKHNFFFVHLFECLKECRKESATNAVDERKENALWLKNNTQCVTEFDCTTKRMNRRGTKKKCASLHRQRPCKHTHTRAFTVFNLT